MWNFTVRTVILSFDAISLFARIAKHGTQNFCLSGAERLGIARLASLVQEILRARNKLSGK